MKQNRYSYSSRIRSCTNRVLLLAGLSGMNLIAGEAGKLSEEIWTGITGTSITALTSNSRFPNTPTSVSKISGVEPTINIGDSYGRRLRGYLTAPQTGNYTFWIAGDDSCELWLSTSTNPANKQRIAWNTAYTSLRQWTKYSTQKSSAVALVQGERYYLEVLHKEGTGGDNISIAWQPPIGVQTVIPASAVDAFEVVANDSDNDGLPDDWEVANGLSIDPVTGGQGNGGPNGDPDGDGFSNREEWLQHTSPTVYGTIPGGLKREVWQGITGTTVASLSSFPAFLKKPNFSGFMAGGLSPSNIADNYGERLRGYVTIPTTGSYRFFVAGDDDCELWVSGSGSPFDKTKAAYFSGWTAVDEWTKYSSQKSAPLDLQQGQVVYVEVLHKESVGGDFAALGWCFNEGMPTTIPASQLAAYAIPQNDRDDDSLPDDWEAAFGFDLTDNGQLHSDQMWNADPDRDGYTNLQEAVFDTDPYTRSGVPGSMTREVWYNLPGSLLSDFTSSPRYWQHADSVSLFTGSAAPSNAGDYFAARIRAHLIAPVSGDYTFWIASDDDSELRLSSDASKFKRVKIASLTGYVDPQSWDTKSTQKSALIHLEAGQRYFIEVLHKESRGNDHCEIAWQIPGGSRELIPASALESFSADPNDIDNDDLPDDWELTQGFSLSDNGTVNPAQHPLADPDHDGYTNLEEGEYGTNPNIRSGIPGTLLLETWNNLGGAQLGDLAWSTRLMESPDTSELVFAAETPIDRADDFAARMRGYIIAPMTGNYTFQLAGDDFCQLWLSPTESQFAKQKIASVDGWTDVRQWTKYPAQTCATVSLVAGQKYYVEALMKENLRGDHLEIGWKTPDSSITTVIPSSALESYAYDANDADGDNMPDDWEVAHGLNTAINDAAVDADQDGIPNYLEYASGTDPQVKNAISGGLLHEVWLDVPGYKVKDLVNSKKYLEQPNFRTLVSSAQTVSQPYDSFGSRLRGYLTAPVTGAYTFWVQGDDETELWLASSSSKFDKQLLVRPSLNTYSFDTDISQKSRQVNLVAGQQYYIEILHKDYYTTDFCQVAWTVPGAEREIIPGAFLQTFIPIANDQDDDDLPDDWEIANGLSPTDDGLINSNNGYQGDLDGDGLTNAAELKAGTRADLADTDGDGINDGDEVEMMETSALRADAAPFEPVTTLSGDAYTDSSGHWMNEDGKARQDCVRAWLEYPVTLPAAGVYLFDLAFTPAKDTEAFPDYEIVFYADGKIIQRETTSVAGNNGGHSKILSPWLAAGIHTLRIFIDNSHFTRRVTINQLNVLAARGPDANGNGTPDWVDLRLVKHNSLEVPSESIISPVCLEGKARWFEMTTINSAPVQNAPDDRWFTNVALNSDQPTSIEASLENGAIQISHQVTWIPVNLNNSGDLTVRQGDSLKLTAFLGQEGTFNEQSIITLEGQSHTVRADQPLIHQFNTVGSVPIQVFNSENGPSTTVLVNVVAAPLLESPVCVVGFDRVVEIPALQNGVFFQLDPRIDIGSTTTNSDGSKSDVLRLNTLDDRVSVFRIGGTTGPIIGTLPFRSMRVRDAGDTAMSFVEELGDNTFHVIMPVIVNGLHPGIVLKYDIFHGGVTFDDGGLSKSLLIPTDFTPDGEHVLNFYKSGTSGSSCHRLSIFQGERRIAYRQ